MKDVYESCPEFEDGTWLLRFVRKEDADDLLAVYGDRNALPFFNSDNCHGDNFYYNTKEKMDKAIDFWLYSYGQKYFVRWTVIEKTAGKAVGTIEMFRRPAGADFGEGRTAEGNPFPHNTPCLRDVRLRGDNLQGPDLRGRAGGGVRRLRLHEDQHLPDRR